MTVTDNQSPYTSDNPAQVSQYSRFTVRIRLCHEVYDRKYEVQPRKRIMINLLIKISCSLGTLS